MVTLKAFTKMALALEGAQEQPHFDKTSFRVSKKIFATLDHKLQQASLKLTPIDQSVFCAWDPAVIFPVPNKWGIQGWTIVDLKKVPTSMCRDALAAAYKNIIAKQ